MSWYRRHELDTFTMYMVGIPAGVSGFFCMLCVPRIVNRFGDLIGIWIPSTVCEILFGLCVALIPGSHWYLACFLFPIFGGPAGGLGGFTPELMLKMIPSDIIGSYSTAKSFVYDVQSSVFVWPWLGLLTISENYSYP